MVTSVLAANNMDPDLEFSIVVPSENEDYLDYIKQYQSDIEEVSYLVELLMLERLRTFASQPIFMITMLTTETDNSVKLCISFSTFKIDRLTEYTILIRVVLG